jgi:hypothetical protein
VRVPAWWLVLAIVLGIALGLGLSSRAPARPASAQGGPAVGEAQLEAIAIELGEIRRLLAVVPPGTVPTERRPVGENAGESTDASPVLGAIALLENNIGAQLAELRRLLEEVESPANRLARVRDEGRTIDWAALNSLVATWRYDKEAAEKEVELLSVERVIDRFGPPARVWTNSNGLHWEYAGEGAGDWKQVILRVPDGYVTNLIVR